uniref:Uncharacterized protein n=1 Tax=Cacopsylla melanoneura TaxID=428564 RepID=A0A8D9DT71_9HEMI
MQMSNRRNTTIGTVQKFSSKVPKNKLKPHFFIGTAQNFLTDLFQIQLDLRKTQYNWFCSTKHFSKKRKEIHAQIETGKDRENYIKKRRGRRRKRTKAFLSI